MNKIISLYNELNRAGVRFYHWDMDDVQAVTIEQGGQYGVFMDFGNIHTGAEELVVVAHEGGHISTGATHRVDSPYDLVEKHEYKADKWAVQRLIPEEALDEAVAGGCTELWQLAEHFGVTEEFMKKAVCWYVHGNLASELYF
ncbi:MAG: ImmA/IrrE family metallo-endopeptidase [Oscillospiraceae bacterium]